MNSKLVGLRKFIIGMAYIIFNSVLIGMVLMTVPSGDLMGALGALSSTIVTMGAGVYGVIYGNIKENQIKKEK